MTTREVFLALAPLVEPLVYETYHRRDLCILSAALALDVCQYFGVEARAMAVRLVVYNRAFAAHVEAGTATSFTRDNWPQDGSHSVGVGFGAPDLPPSKWDGHLIVAAPDCFGDFAIRQAERRERDIITGPAVVANFPGGERWQLENDWGTTLEYTATDDTRYVRAPDWRDKTRRRKLAGRLIRLVKALE